MMLDHDNNDILFQSNFNDLIDEFQDKCEEKRKEKNSRNNDKKLDESKRPKKQRRGGYKPVLVPLDELKQESKYLEPKLKSLIQNYQSKHFNQPDTVSLYILIYIIKRYPQHFLESYDQIYSNKNELDKVQSKSVQQECLDLNYKLKNRLNQTNTNRVFDIINNYNLHSIPKSARIALVYWYLGLYNIKLLLYVPTVEEVVELQSNKERCVSLISESLDDLVEGHRDPLSFALHDLVHAFKMFSNYELLKGQVAFSILMLKVLKSGLIKDLLENDAEFNENFNYCVSDMNSHSKHLFYTFKSSLINAYKRKFNVKSNDLLNDQSLEQFNSRFELILNEFEMNVDERESARNMLNDNKQFNQFDFTVLNNYFLSLYDRRFNQ